MVKEKEREGNELKFSIAESNEESQANIEMKRRATQTNIMVIRRVYTGPITTFFVSANRLAEHPEAD